MPFINELRKRISVDVFSDRDIAQHFREKSAEARNSAIQRAIANKTIIKIKRGLYCFEETLLHSGLSKYYVANLLYTPSYISFESALSEHGLIPEGVYTTTSTCYTQRNKSFKTPIGDFTYNSVPQDVFDLEVLSKKNHNTHFLIAKPLKALFDLVYKRRKKYKTAIDLETDLRIELSDLEEISQNYSAKELNELAQLYKKQSVNNLCKILIEEFK